MKFIRIFLFILIIIGIVALFTMKFWVPKLVDQIVSSEFSQTIKQETQTNTSP